MFNIGDMVVLLDEYSYVVDYGEIVNLDSDYVTIHSDDNGQLVEYSRDMCDIYDYEDYCDQDQDGEDEVVELTGILSRLDIYTRFLRRGRFA